MHLGARAYRRKLVSAVVTHDVVGTPRLLGWCISGALPAVSAVVTHDVVGTPWSLGSCISGALPAVSAVVTHDVAGTPRLLGWMHIWCITSSKCSGDT